MYKLIKDKGNNSNVAIQNTDTKAEVIIGRLSMTIVDILNKAGHSINTGDEDSLKYKDAWDIVIDEDTKNELQRLAMRMMKPKRAKVEKVEEKEAQKQIENKNIDAMDVLLGLAKYN